MRLGLLVLLSGCYLHHTLDPDASEPPVDAGLDVRDVGPDVPLDVGTCFAGAFVQVEAVGCALDLSRFSDDTSFFDPSAMSVDERLRIDVLTPDGSSCTLLVDGLSEPIRDGFIARFARMADGWMELSSRHIEVHDTSLCDGPEPDECPLAMLVKTGGGGYGDGWLRIRVEYGEQVCAVRPCGALHELAFEWSEGGGEPELITLAQGEISGDADSAWRLANIRSWQTCTDEGPYELNWAFWTQ